MNNGNRTVFVVLMVLAYAVLTVAFVRSDNMLLRWAGIMFVTNPVYFWIDSKVKD